MYRRISEWIRIVQEMVSDEFEAPRTAKWKGQSNFGMRHAEERGLKLARTVRPDIVSLKTI